MSENANQLEQLLGRGYQHGFVTDIDSDTVPPGLDEDVVRLISHKKQRAGVPHRVAPEGAAPLAARCRSRTGRT